MESNLSPTADQTDQLDQLWGQVQPHPELDVDGKAYLGHHEHKINPASFELWITSGGGSTADKSWAKADD